MSFSKESLEILRQKIDLAEVLAPYVQLKSSGQSFKALCPFHEEKSPSFVIQKGDRHYHCYGCGAHGDAIQFLIGFLKMSFADAVQNLADKFNVTLEQGQSSGYKGPSKALLKDALEIAVRFFHFYLLHSKEGHEALSYLYQRGMDLDFIKTFQLGYAPKSSSLFQDYMREKKVKDQILELTGLIKYFGPKKRDFFMGRVMFPIRDSVGQTIAFSARKMENSYGPKYINTPETPLFKKSKILFGLSYCRRRIAKERRVILVEGQIDCLRMIYSGFDITVASQGTAFTEDHVRELIMLGVKHIYIAFDPDEAGLEASEKIGYLFQKEGLEVSVVKGPSNTDPDQLIMDKGPQYFQNLIEQSNDYLSFLVEKHSKKHDMSSPAQKTDMVKNISEKIRTWDHPLMVHESLRKLAKLTQTPESMIGMPQTEKSQFKKSESISHQQIDPDRILEADLLRWLFLMGESIPNLVVIAKKNLQEKHFKVRSCFRLFSKFLKMYEEDQPKDLLSFTVGLENTEDQLFLSEILQKRVNRDRAEECFLETVKQILERRWMERREEIKEQIYSGKSSESELMDLAKEFDKLKKERPQVGTVEI